MSATWFRRDLLDDRRADDGLTVPCPLALLGPPEEHVALLALPARSGPLRRKDDLLDEGVVAIFGLAGGEAELLGLCFDAGQFTPAQAARWLAERGLTPLLFVPNAGGRHGCPRLIRWPADPGCAIWGRVEARDRTLGKLPEVS